ncbi:hypothetical protein Q3O93_24255 [Ralstonia pseudosolanacearum]|nr:hypothetical protein [Ralstonia pseudosolanacearum]MDO3530167.1 hypothetical protein [Ralstonia pseudosolanacearum]MDO3535015.1 hypothetical protein [Ralstonia pseudosolanacearum]
MICSLMTETPALTWAIPAAALSPAVLADAASSPKLRSADVMARLSPSSAPSSATRMEMRWFATYDFSLTGSGTECRKQQLKAAGELAGLMPLATTPFFSAWLCAPALDGFLRAHPGLRVELMEDRRNLDISRREADVAYGCCAHRHRGSSRGEWEKLPSPAIHTPPRRRHRPAE